MTNEWNEFNTLVNVNEINAGINELSKAGDYDEVPYGKYEVKIELMECVKSKNGNPMLKVRFRILEGRQHNRLIFMNQVVWVGDVNDKYRMNAVVSFINSLETSQKIVQIQSLGELADSIRLAFEEIQNDKLEFLLNYYEDKKGYAKYMIEDVYEA